ncbi:Uncharacterized protein SCF082_LOCUS40899, partial [Durusdinium trenchii]
AFSLIGFLVMSTGVVYLVHCHDDDIRRASWDLVNTTLSIFCAASFDFGVVRALTTIILKIRTGDELTEVFEVEEEREKVLGDWRFILFVGAMACFWFFLLHGYLLHEDNHRRLFAASTLGGHLFAFAGILVFGHIQKYNPCWQWLLAVVLVALIFMVFLYGAILKYVKRNCCGEMWKHKKQQVHLLKDMQLEASAIVVGFLLVQTICYAGSTEQGGKEREERKVDRFMPILTGTPVHPRHWFLVWFLFGFAFVLIWFSAYWSIKCQMECRRRACCSSVLKLFTEWVGKLASTTGCWCLQRGGLIGFYYICKVRMDFYHNTAYCNQHRHRCKDQRSIGVPLEELSFNDLQA